MPTRQKILKRSLVAVIALFGLACIVLIATSKSETGRDAPRFVPGTPIDAVTNLAASANYSWGEDVPFQGGRTWIWFATSRTNFHTYWVNLDDRTVVGELFNAGAEFSNKDQTKLFCSGPGSLLPTLKQRWAGWLAKVSGGKIKPQLNRDETFWILDLRNNRAKAIGSFSQSAGNGSRWHPAPGFRFAYNIPSTSGLGQEFYLCDLEQEQMTRVQFQGSIQGWWDERHLLAVDKPNNFLLFDVITRQTRPLITAAELQDFLKKSGLPISLGMGAEPTWTGEEYAFHLAAKTNGIRSVATLLKASPARTSTNIPSTTATSPELQIFQRDFQFEWLGRLNAAGTLYVFPGESGQPGSGGDGSVHIRDVRTGESRTLVESDHSNQYTLPRFYKDRVLYMRSRQLWSIDVNGSNNFKVFQLP